MKDQNKAISSINNESDIESQTSAINGQKNGANGHSATYGIEVEESGSSDYEESGSSDHNEKTNEDENETLIKKPTDQSTSEKQATFTTKKIIPLLLASATAAPTAINGIVAPEKGATSSIVDPDWWKSLAPGELSLSVLNGASSFTINVLVNLFYLPKAMESLKTNVKEFPEHPIRSSLAFLLGIGGAVSAAMIAYEAFLLFPGITGQIIACTAALLNLVIFSATRFVGSDNLLKKASNLLDENVKTKNEFVDLLEHIKPEHAKSISNNVSKHFIDLEKPITLDELNSVIETLATELEKYHNDNGTNDILRNRSKSETFLNGLSLLIDLSLAAAIGLPAVATFMQKSFDGINKVSQFINGNSLNDLPIGFKRGIGFLGLGSGALYANSASEFRQVATNFSSVAVNLCKNAYHELTPYNLLQVGLLLTFLAGNALSASSMQNIGDSIKNRPDNIAFISDNFYGQLYVGLIAAGGAMVNFNASANQLYLSQPLLPLDLVNKENFNKLITHLRKTTIKNDDTISKMSSAVTFFKNPQNGKSVNSNPHPSNGYGSDGYGSDCYSDEDNRQLKSTSLTK